MCTTVSHPSLLVIWPIFVVPSIIYVNNHECLKYLESTEDALGVECPRSRKRWNVDTACAGCTDASIYVRNGVQDDTRAVGNVRRLQNLVRNLTWNLMWINALLTEGHAFTEGQNNCIDDFRQIAARLVTWLYILSPNWGHSRIKQTDARMAALFDCTNLIFPRDLLDSTFKRSNAWALVKNYLLAPANNNFISGLGHRPSTGQSYCTSGPFQFHRNDCQPHHPVFRRFPPVTFGNDYHRGYTVDFLGCRQRPEGNATRVGDVISTATATRIEMLVRYQNNSTTPSPLPFVDEEYFEFIDVLTAIVEVSDAGKSELTVVEVGSGSGAPWASRAVAAWRHLNGQGAKCRVGLIEVDPVKVADLHASLDNIGLSGCDVTIWDMDVRSVPLAEVLAQFSSIDYLDIDIQGHELALVRESREFLRQRVGKIHIGTHSREIHFKLEQSFLQDGWDVVWSFPTLSYSETPFGHVVFTDGVLTMKRKQK